MQTLKEIAESEEQKKGNEDLKEEEKVNNKILYKQEQGDIGL